MKYLKLFEEMEWEDNPDQYGNGNFQWPDDNTIRRNLGLSGNNLMPDYIIDQYCRIIKEIIDDDEERDPSQRYAKRDLEHMLKSIKDVNGCVPQRVIDLLPDNLNLEYEI